jgi:hypothetical protein
MPGARTVILAGALVAVLAVVVVFRVRVFVAGGKLVLALAAILVVAWIVWPKRDR